MTSSESTIGSGWGHVGDSVIGSSHVRAGEVNQDAIGACSASYGGGEAALVVAVADGHGSATYVRSDRGSGLAVAAALDALGTACQQLGHDDLASLRSVRDELSREVVRSWRVRVQQDLEERPLEPHEIDRVRTGRGAGKADELLRTPTVAYGSTLIAAALTRDYGIFIQIGDGDLLVRPRVGAVWRPFARDDRHLADETLSLVSPEAWLQARVAIVPFATGQPLAVFLATDGVGNSVRDDDDLARIFVGLHERIRTHGLDAVQAGLGAYLNHLTDTGSGDDATLALAVPDFTLVRPSDESVQASHEAPAVAPRTDLVATPTTGDEDPPLKTATNVAPEDGSQAGSTATPMTGAATIGSFHPHPLP